MLRATAPGFLLMLALSGCNAVNATSALPSSSPSASDSSYTLTIAVTGLATNASVVIHEAVGTDPDLTITSNTSSSFATNRANGSSYNITVATQPIGQTCTIAAGSGTISADTTVKVECATSSSSSSTSSSVAIDSISAPSSKTYKVGETLDFSVTFHESVTVTGIPTMALILGSTTVNASYLSGSGTSTLVFRYTIQSGDSDSNGVNTAGTITLGSATIKNASGTSGSTTFTGANFSGVIVWTPPSCSGFTAGAAVVDDIFNDNVAATNTGSGAVGTGWGIVTNAHITATEASSRLSLDLSGGSVVDTDQYKMNSNQKQAFFDSQGVRVKWTTAPVSVTQASSTTNADYAPITQAALRYQLGWIDAVRSNASNADNQFWRLPQANGTGGQNGGGGFYVELYFKPDPNDASKSVVGGAINVATVEKTQRTETTTAVDSTKIGSNGLGTFTFDSYDGTTPLTVTALLNGTTWTVCLSESVSMATGSLSGSWSSMPTPFTHNEFVTASLVTYGNAVLTAQTTGVAVVFDGTSTISSVVSAWNAAHPSDHLTFFSKPGLATAIDGTYVPAAGTATLAATTVGGFADVFVQAVSTGGRGTMGFDQISVDRGQ